MRGSKPGDQMRFQVHGHRAGKRMQFLLIRGIRKDGVDAHWLAVPFTPAPGVTIRGKPLLRFPRECRREIF
jgi:hypothetical protein